MDFCGRRGGVCDWSWGRHLGIVLERYASVGTDSRLKNTAFFLKQIRLHLEIVHAFNMILAGLHKAKSWHTLLIV
jgi:hypothetical protein